MHLFSCLTGTNGYLSQHVTKDFHDEARQAADAFYNGEKGHFDAN